MTKLVKIFFYPALLLSLFFAACGSSDSVTYRPAGSNANWEINVLHSDISGLTENFKVIINDSTVINQNANFVTGKTESKGKYKGYDVKLVLSYSYGFLGLGSGYDAVVFINEKLAAEFSF